MSLLESLSALAADFSGTLGVAARNLATGEVINLNAEILFYPASTIKVPVLVEVYRQVLAGSLSLDETLPLDPDLTVPDGGIMDGFTPNFAYPVRDLAHLMITISDNSATNVLIRRIGFSNVNATLARLGMSQTRLFRYLGLPTATGPRNETAPADMAHLMELLVREEILTPAACRAVLGTMSHQVMHHLTTRYLDDWDEELPPEQVKVRVATKPGWIRGVRNDVAAVWAPRATYALAMFSQNCTDESYKLDNEAALLLPKVSRAIYDAWGRA